ncbi:MAG: penicillin-binding protein 1C [Alphaproteobacteria bacterium]|nr:penicillin-binding protein 1C [Alphaproteobacteria bacterium]MBL7097704.1 penicillin-binding protein 1C [Alphaproteobacteria bacterium]
MAVFTLFGIVCAVATADAANPPDMTRFMHVSPEVVDRNGKPLRAFLTKDGYWRMKTTVADVSPRYLKMLEAYEDKRFADHYGVDALAILRATAQFLSAGHVLSGGSTLTMQVARILEPPKSRGILTKLFQMMRAIQLEERYSKDEILTMYMTLAPFGGNLEGVRAASLSYFGKPPDQIDLSEAALLVALPQSPVKQRPDRHAIRAARGRDKVLARVAAAGVITEGDAAVARREGVPFARQPMPMIAPHLAVRLKLRHRDDALIATTLDAGTQAAVERLAVQEQPYFGEGTSLAIVVVENRTRNVVAYLGGVNFWGKNGQIDLAQRNRSPGSALKPFIYGMAFDQLILHPASLMSDAPTMFGDYAPKDFEGTFQGTISARDALRMSLNIPAVMVLDRVGPLSFTTNLENAGARLDFPAGESAPSLPVALGGLGISLADITMLYSGIANGGEVRALRYIQGTPDGAAHRIFGPVAAFYLKQILRGVALPDGWAMGQGINRARQVGFKTGTSYGYRDAWSVGFSNDYTVGVWVGRADGSPRAGHVGRESAAPILLKTFELLPPDIHADEAPPPGALLTNANDQLPPSMRVFRRESAPAPPKETAVPPPTIAFPPNGTVVPLPPDSAKDHTIVLKADGGKEPLTWLVNGQLIGNFDRFHPVLYTPDGEGLARITVVDSAGRSDTSQVRFKRAKS